MIVITGATGKVGSKIVSKLLAKGKKVKALGRNVEQLNGFKNKGALIEITEPNNVSNLTKAFTDADVVFLILPPNFQAEDVIEFHDEIGKAQIEAIKNSGVKKVIFLSSQGAGDYETTGVVIGVGKQEQRLNALENVDVLHLRPTYFMENILALLPMVEASGIIGTPIKSDLKMAIIATEDIAEVASQRLETLDFTGKQYLDLLGNKDYNHTEIASIIGKLLGKENLPYIEFSYEDNKKGLMQFGVSESMANYFNALYKGLNDEVVITGQRTEKTTTPTSFETFLSNTLNTESNEKSK